MSQKSSTVFVVEDDKDTCEVITHLLDSVKLPVKTFVSPHAFLEAFKPSFKGCLVLDVRLPEMSGLDLYEEIKKSHSSLPVIFLSGYADISMVVRAMKAGAFDFVVKPFNNQILLDQIQRAMALVPISTTKTQFLEHLESLTVREREILKHIVAGEMNKEIAYVLGISISTVELHRANLMEKLKVKNLAELIKNYLLTHPNLLS